MKIVLVTGNNFISYVFTYPLLVWRRELASCGYHIILTNLSGSMKAEGDCFLIDSKSLSHIWPDNKKIFELLHLYRKRSSKIIWSDTTDSTGIIQPQVIPYVDRYLKKQLLIDKTLYLKRLYNSRLYSDYYKKLYNLRDETVDTKGPIKSDAINKLCVSWNLALYNYGDSKVSYNVKRFLPFFIKNKASFQYHKVISWAETDRKSRDLTYRCTTNYCNQAQSIQRIKIKEIVEKLNCDTSMLSKRQYRDEIKKSKIGISPFGAGEICFRDFELILNNTVMLKPSMDHLETWPDVYKSQKTYIPFKWDMSDLISTICESLSDRAKLKLLAEGALTRYQKFIGKEGFSHFIKQFSKVFSFEDVSA